MENILNRSELEAARDWLKDCVWNDLESEDVDDLSDAQVTKGIARHFGGGISAFKETF